MQTWIQKGFVFKSNEQKLGHFNLEKWLKQTLTKWKISFNDECCTPDTLSSPVRLNETTGKLQYFDKDTKLWTNVVASMIS